MEQQLKWPQERKDSLQGKYAINIGKSTIKSINGLILISICLEKLQQKNIPK